MLVNCETPEGRRDELMTIVLDGYNAPVSAGHFLDLVLRGFYDGMEVQRADGFVVQVGGWGVCACACVDGRGATAQGMVQVGGGLCWAGHVAAG